MSKECVWSEWSDRCGILQRKSTMYPTTNTACAIPRTCYACLWVINNIAISISCSEKVHSNSISIKAPSAIIF